MAVANTQIEEPALDIVKPLEEPESTVDSEETLGDVPAEGHAIPELDQIKAVSTPEVPTVSTSYRFSIVEPSSGAYLVSYIRLGFIDSRDRV